MKKLSTVKPLTQARVRWGYAILALVLLFQFPLSFAADPTIDFFSGIERETLSGRELKQVLERWDAASIIELAYPLVRG